MKNLLSYFLRAIQFFAFVVFLYFLLKSDKLPDTETKVNEVYALLNMEEAYKKARPTDTLSALNPEQATVMNAMVHLFDKSLYVTFPRYDSSRSFLEFDSLVNRAFTRQTTFFREEGEEIRDNKNRYSTYQIIGAATVIFMLLLDRYVFKKPEEEESEPTG